MNPALVPQKELIEWHQKADDQFISKVHVYRHTAIEIIVGGSGVTDLFAHLEQGVLDGNFATNVLGRNFNQSVKGCTGRGGDEVCIVGAYGEENDAEDWEGIPRTPWLFGEREEQAKEKEREQKGEGEKDNEDLEGLEHMEKP